MGYAFSKETEEPYVPSSDEFDRSSKHRRSSKEELAETKIELLKNLKTEIDIFAGNRRSPRYAEFHEILTKISKDLQNMKGKTSKQQTRDRCDEGLAEAQRCFQKLEEKVTENERTDKDLDMAAVESHSFVNHSFAKQQKQAHEKKNNQQAKTKYDSIKSLKRLEYETYLLEKDIKTCIELGDFKRFVLFKRKIEILMTNLEMMQAEKHTPLSEKKETISKRLIRCNHLLKRAKDGSLHNLSSGREVVLKNISKIEHHLENLGMQALTFEGLKDDAKYLKIRDTLDDYFKKLSVMSVARDEEMQRRNLTIHKITNTLEELKRRAEENQRKVDAQNTLKQIQNQIHEVQNLDLNLTEDVIRSDQKLRALWAQIAQIEDVNDDVQNEKFKLVGEIKKILKELSEKIQTNSSKSEEDMIEQQQLLQQTKEFQVHWNQFCYNLDVRKFTDVEILKQVEEILRKISDGVDRKIGEMEHVLTKTIIADSSEKEKAQKNTFNKNESLKRTKKTQQLIEIDAEIQGFRQQIKKFSGVTKDKNYDQIKNGLWDCLTKLQLIEGMNLSKQESIRHIQQYHQELETKLAENQAKVRIKEQNNEHKKQISEQIRKIAEDVQKLKIQIENLNNDQNNIEIYKTVDEGLNQNLININEIDDSGDHKFQSAKIQIKQNIRKLLKTVENQRKNNQKRYSDPSSPYFKINSFREKLEDLHQITETFDGQYKDEEYIKIEMDIFNAIDELRQLDDGGHQSVQNGKKQFERYLQELLKYFDDKMRQKSESILIIDCHNELAIIEKKIEDFKNKIDDVEVPPADLQLFSITITRELDEIEVGNVLQMREIKKKLVEELENCKRILEDRLKVNDILKRVERISKDVRRFSGTKNDENYNFLDESLIELTIELDNLELEHKNELKNVRIKAVHEIQENMNVLKQKALAKSEIALSLAPSMV